MKSFRFNKFIFIIIFVVVFIALTAACISRINLIIDYKKPSSNGGPTTGEEDRRCTCGFKRRMVTGIAGRETCVKDPCQWDAVTQLPLVQNRCGQQETMCICNVAFGSVRVTPGRSYTDPTSEQRCINIHAREPGLALAYRQECRLFSCVYGDCSNRALMSISFSTDPWFLATSSAAPTCHTYYDSVSGPLNEAIARLLVMPSSKHCSNTYNICITDDWVGIFMHNWYTESELFESRPREILLVHQEMNLLSRQRRFVTLEKQWVQMVTDTRCWWDLWTCKSMTAALASTEIISFLKSNDAPSKFPVFDKIPLNDSFAYCSSGEKCAATAIVFKCKDGIEENGNTLLKLSTDMVKGIVSVNDFKRKSLIVAHRWICILPYCVYSDESNVNSLHYFGRLVTNPLFLHPDLAPCSSDVFIDYDTLVFASGRLMRPKCSAETYETSGYGEAARIARASIRMPYVLPLEESLVTVEFQEA
jgi:hypothetical protein